MLFAPSQLNWEPSSSLLSAPIQDMSSESSSLRRITSFAAIIAVIALLLVIGIYAVDVSMEFKPVSFRKRISKPAQDKFLSVSVNTQRKLLNHGKGNVPVEPNRIWSEKCSKSDIVLSQGATNPLPNGIPTYTVEIMNVCVSGCDIAAIHLNCGWFSSARVVNPRIFKRVRFNDCLVNEGKPLRNGRILSFQYANTFRYPLSVASVKC